MNTETDRLPGSTPAGVLVIGLGNPILGDDGVGWAVAGAVSAALGPTEDVETDCLSVGGLALMERMLGHRRVILVDSIDSGADPVGTVRAFPLAELRDPSLGHSASAHDASLVTALLTAKAMGGQIPERVEIVSIEARPCHDFSEELSPVMRAAIPQAMSTVLTLLRT